MSTHPLVDAAIERLDAAGLLPFVGDVSARWYEGQTTAIVTVPHVAPQATYASARRVLADIPHVCVLADEPARGARSASVEKDGRTWRIGTQDDVAWINDGTVITRAISAAIPPVFERYATVVVPDDDAERRAADATLLRLLSERTPEPWWLGYLDTGAHDVVLYDAWKVIVYTGWSYVLVEAGPGEAATWRADGPWHEGLPELIFPPDHSWLVSMLWDDDWRCLGGSADLVDAVLADPAIDAREVQLGEDATPPGFTSY